MLASAPLRNGLTFGAASAAGDTAENCPGPPAVKPGRSASNVEDLILFENTNLKVLADLQLVLSSVA